MGNALIIYDDNPDVVTFIERVAEDQNFNVHSATTSDDFWQAVETAQNGAIILDLELDQTTGIAILKELAARKFNAPILLISGYHSDILRSAVRLGAKDGLDVRGWLQKPFELTDLVHELQSLR